MPAIELLSCLNLSQYHNDLNKRLDLESTSVFITLASSLFNRYVCLLRDNWIEI